VIGYLSSMRRIPLHPIPLVVCLACYSPPVNTASPSSSPPERYVVSPGPDSSEPSDVPVLSLPSSSSPEVLEFDKWGNQIQGCVKTEENTWCPPDQPNAISNAIRFEPADCVAGVCEPTVGVRVPLDMYPNCDLACPVSGQKCVAQGCSGGTMFVFSSDDFGGGNPDTGGPVTLDIACDASPPAQYLGVGSHVACCCV
jgi:hypothetical protein